jgi:hypothetical protein
MFIKGFMVILLIIGVTSLIAADNIQDFSYGKVNWSKKIIVVTGSGAPNLKSKSPSQARLGAERAAKLDAYRNALEVVKGLKIKSSLTIEKLMEGDKTIATQVQGIIRGGKEKGKKYYDDGGVDIILEIPLDGILPMNKFLSKKTEKLTSGKEKKYTSLVVNLLNFKYDKVILPIIKNESNKVVYSVDLVEREAYKKLIVTYFKNIDDAKLLMGNSPLIIDAKSLSDKEKSTVIISDADSDKFINGKVDLTFLKEAKVIFITK